MAPKVPRGPQDRPESRESTASMAIAAWIPLWTEALAQTEIMVKTVQTERPDSLELMGRWGRPETQAQPELRGQREMPEPRGPQVNRESVQMDSMESRAQTASPENSAKSDLLV